MMLDKTNKGGLDKKMTIHEFGKENEKAILLIHTLRSLLLRRDEGENSRL